MMQFGLAGLVVCAATLVGADGSGNPPIPPKQETKRDYLISLLSNSRIVDFPGFDDPKLTLQDALEYLANRYDLAFDVDEKAFGQKFGKDGQGSVLTEEIAKTPLPPARNARLDNVIRKILVRIDVPSGATYLIRRDHVYITTQAAASKEILGDPKLPLPPLVQGRVDKCPLQNALSEIAESTEVSVVLDESVAEKGSQTVTARFLNTPVDTAVRVLANRANLSVVRLDNVLYVTTPEKAASLRRELEAEKGKSPRPMPLADEEKSKPAESQK